MATTATLQTLYYLLFARYGSSHIRSDYPEQWRMKVMSTIFMYGPTWAKQLEIQEKVISLTQNEIEQGNVAIYNSAANPDTAPKTDSWEALDGINNQSQTLKKRGKLESYGAVAALLDENVTATFLERFAPLFDLVAAPQRPLWYPEVGASHEDIPVLMNDMIYGNYATATFEEEFPDFESFNSYYTSCGIPTTIPSM